jgi:hypothetical protein
MTFSYWGGENVLSGIARSDPAVEAGPEGFAQFALEDLA